MTYLPELNKDTLDVRMFDLEICWKFTWGVGDLYQIHWAIFAGDDFLSVGIIQDLNTCTLYIGFHILLFWRVSRHHWTKQTWPYLFSYQLMCRKMVVAVGGREIWDNSWRRLPSKSLDEKTVGTECEPLSRQEIAWLCCISCAMLRPLGRSRASPDRWKSVHPHDRRGKSRST